MVALGWALHNAFVVESFLDEMPMPPEKTPSSSAAPSLLTSPPSRGTGDGCRKAGWGTPLPAGRGRGIAVHESYGSFVAHVAEVSVDPKGKVLVHRVVCAVDCGRYVNPDASLHRWNPGSSSPSPQPSTANHPEKRPCGAEQFP